VAGLFLVTALSLAGIPPLSGFVAKVGLLQPAADAEEWGILGVALVASLLTLYSIARIWTNAFWGEPVDPVGPAAARAAAGGDEGPARTGVMVGATAALAVLSLALAAGAGPVFDLATRAAEDLLAPERYVAAVLG
jgi:multicomponent Na+:H+ antiporter subunit D